jgi:hypothetical protein
MKTSGLRTLDFACNDATVPIVFEEQQNKIVERQCRGQAWEPDIPFHATIRDFNGPDFDRHLFVAKMNSKKISSIHPLQKLYRKSLSPHNMLQKMHSKRALISLFVRNISTQKRSEVSVMISCIASAM